MGKPLYTAIVFFANGQNTRKYRNISNLDTFSRFMATLGASYCNLYHKENKLFFKRLYA